VVGGGGGVWKGQRFSVDGELKKKNMRASDWGTMKRRRRGGRGGGRLKRAGKKKTSNKKR